MNTRRSLLLGALGGCLLSCTVSASAQTDSVQTDSAQTGYTLADLGPADGAGYAVAMNEQGQVVGTYGGHALFWADGKRTDLGTLKPEEDDGGETRAEPYGINNRGMVVGTSGSFAPATFGGGGGLDLSRGFIVQNNAPMRQWTDNRISFTPCAVNDAGEIVGMDGVRGFVYIGGKFRDLNTLSTRPGGNRSTARGISQSGLVVGWSTINSRVRDPQTGSQFGLLPTHAFLWRRGTGQGRESAGRMRDLGTLRGCVDSYAYAVNRRGEIVGCATDGTADFEGVNLQDAAAAFLWRGGRIIALPKLPGRKHSEAFAINDSTEIAGSCDSRAVVWRQGKITDLNTCLPPASGWTLEQAQAINNRGQIAGSGTFHGQPHLFLLTPNIP